MSDLVNVSAMLTSASADLGVVKALSYFRFASRASAERFSRLLQAKTTALVHLHDILSDHVPSTPQYLLIDAEASGAPLIRSVDERIANVIENRTTSDDQYSIKSRRAERHAAEHVHRNFTVASDFAAGILV